METKSQYCGLKAIGKKTKAIDYYEKAIEINPIHVETLENKKMTLNEIEENVKKNISMNIHSLSIERKVRFFFMSDRW